MVGTRSHENAVAVAKTTSIRRENVLARALSLEQLTVATYTTRPLIKKSSRNLCPPSLTWSRPLPILQVAWQRRVLSE